MMEELKRKWELCVNSEKVYERIKTDILSDPFSQQEEKNEVWGIIYEVVKYLDKPDKYLEFHSLKFFEETFHRTEKKIDHYVNKTKFITPKTADILEKIMEKTIARRKDLPPYDPDRFGWNDPYIKLPWPFSESILEQDKHLFTWFLYDPKTQSYVYGRKDIGEQRPEKAEAFRANKQE